MPDVEEPPPPETPVKLPPPPGMHPASQPSAADNQSSSWMGIVRRLKREDFVKRGSLALRGVALFFSVLAFIIMASNKHGTQDDWRNFDKYEEYRYLLAIAILSTIYCSGQAIRQVNELYTRKQLLPARTMSSIEFFGDQIMAYLLISASSAAIPLTNNMRQNVDNMFTDTSAAAISMAFFAFIAMAVSAGISGYKVSTHSYI